MKATLRHVSLVNFRLPPQAVKVINDGGSVSLLVDLGGDGNRLLLNMSINAADDLAQQLVDVATEATVTVMRRQEVKNELRNALAE